MSVVTPKMLRSIIDLGFENSVLRLLYLYDFNGVVNLIILDLFKFL